MRSEHDHKVARSTAASCRGNPMQKRAMHGFNLARGGMPARRCRGEAWPAPPYVLGAAGFPDSSSTLLSACQVGAES